MPFLSDGEKVITKTTVGLASSEILQHSLEKPGTVIVMGATGDDVIKKLFGSVSVSVINQSAVPVLIVPSACRYQSITTIKYAGALEQVDHDVAPILSALVSRTQAETEVVHVQTRGKKYSSEGMTSALCRNTRKIVKSVEIEGGDVFTALNKYCLKTGADLLVMAREKGNALHGIFHRSTTKSMSSKTHVPLLIIPQK